MPPPTDANFGTILQGLASLTAKAQTTIEQADPQPGAVVTINLNDEAREALGALLDLAYNDQADYLKFGDLGADYGTGDELKTCVEIKTTTFRFAHALENQLFAGSDRWEELAKTVEAALTGAAPEILS